MLTQDLPLEMDVLGSFKGDRPEILPTVLIVKSSVMIISMPGINTVNKTMKNKCLLSKGFVYKVHVVDFYNTFIFMK